ncbi:extracellular solute-binding protein [Blautia schinkii]|nr:extracellular solute-binding protein [Blautia schinkii]
MGKRRIWLGLCMAAVLTGILGATVQVGAADKAGAADKTETVTVWSWDNNFNVKAMKLAEAEYEQEHPDVDIQVVSMEQENIMDQLYNNLSAGIYEELPDIVLIEDYRVKACLQRFGEEFLELGDAVDYGNYVDYKVNAVTLDDRHYGVPFDSGAAVMFYRRDVLAQAGYSDEDMQDITWERYTEIARDVYEATGMKMITLDPSDLGLLRIMLQSAGSWYVKDQGLTADIEDNQVLKEALDVYLKLLRAGITASSNGWDEYVSSYQDGRVATVISGCWSASSIKEKAEQAGKWGVARIPRLEHCEGAVNASGNGGSAWYVLKKGSDGAKARDFLLEMYDQNPDFINLLMEEINLTSVRRDLDTFPNYEKKDDYFGGIPFLKICADVVEDIPDVDFGSYTYEIEDVMASAIQNLLKGESEENVLRQAQIKAQGIIGLK